MNKKNKNKFYLKKNVLNPNYFPFLFKISILWNI